MQVQKLTPANAPFEPLAGQGDGLSSANLVDQRHGGPVTIGYGRYAPNAILEDSIRVHDVMIVLEGSLSVTSDAGTVDAVPGEIVYMPPGNRVTIRAGAEGALTAYVTHPHWQQPEELAARSD